MPDWREPFRRRAAAVRGRPGAAPIPWVLAAGMVVLALGVLDRLAPEFTRGGRPVAVTLTADTRVSQRFDADGRRLAFVRVPAETRGDGATGRVQAALFALEPDGARQVGAATVFLASQTDCCTFAFDAITPAADQAHRLDLVLRGIPEAAQFALLVQPARRPGGLWLNGHRQPSNLLLAGSGVRTPLPGEDWRVHVAAVMACLTVLTGGLVHLVLRVARREPAAAPPMDAGPHPLWNR